MGVRCGSYAGYASKKRCGCLSEMDKCMKFKDTKKLRCNAGVIDKLSG